MPAGHSDPQAAADFLRRFWLVTLLLIALLLLSKPVLSFLGLADFSFRPYLQFAIASAIFYHASIFFKHARHEIQTRQFGMMTLVSLAVFSGYLFSAASTFLPSLKVEFYLEISTLIWVLLFGHYLEARSSAAAGDALKEVAKLLPKKAHLLKGNQVHDVDLTSLKKTDLILIKPGEKVPADGRISQGEANFDEALITGESTPVAKKVADQVIAGSLCLDGSVQVELTRVGRDSTIGQIQQLVSQAQLSKPTAQRLADKAARLLTFTALFVALITILVWTVIIGKPFVFAITLAITVLVIACPHALGLAIPTVSTIATTLAVKNGLFIKNLQKLEVVKDLDFVVFDKTGTLTQGKFGVTDILPLKGQKNLLQIAASLESQSSHVIGQAILAYAQSQAILPLPVAQFKDFPGKGVQGKIKKHQYYLGNQQWLAPNRQWGASLAHTYQTLTQSGKTVIVVADEHQILGLIALADQIKPESKIAIDRLHQLGIKVALLTGDNQTVAQSVAQALNIDTFFAHILPQDKYKHIQTLQDQGNKVMMVGDGINDAPALTQANVGLAIGAGTDVAVEAGDIVLTHNNPQDVARLIVLARRVYRKMVENLIWALGYNLVAIPAAAGLFIPFGFQLRPEIGALLMSLSSVIVVINALTLRKLKLA